MSSNEIREKYLKFFESRGHVRIPPSPLVLKDDPTTLFTSSGMQQLVPYLKGEPHPKGKRLVDSQPSLRLQDIEEVGDNRHTTFFEMLGNWSLGDYFKAEQLPWIWEFFTKELGLPEEKLWVSVFEGLPAQAGTKDVPKDTESIEIWKSLGVPQERIREYGVKKNWWSRSGTPDEMPAGEIGGPDSEVFYDFDPDGKLKIHESSAYKDGPCHPNCECGRFLEIGNSVFMQYKKNEDGTLSELPQKNVDFGGGLERIAAAVNDDPDIFQIGLFQPIVREIIGATGMVVDSDKQYGPDDYPVYPIIHEEKDRAQLKAGVVKAVRIIADHLRAATFILAEDIKPSNKDRGYILRRLLRRAVLYGKDLGINGGFTSRIARKVISVYENIYPNLKEKENFISTEIDLEESKFRNTLEIGLKEFEKYVTAGEVGKPETEKKILFPTDVFFLYETYGFPYELIVEEGERRNIQIPDRHEFELELKKHKELSRTASSDMFKVK